MATWTQVWRVANEGTHLLTYKASTSASGTVTVRRSDGLRERYNAFWFHLHFGATPADAIEKFLLVQQQRLARLERDRAEIEQQATNGRALRVAHGLEVVQ
jgi:hypothetical protein